MSDAVAQLVKNLISSDNEVRKEAESLYSKAKKDNPKQAFSSFTTAMCDSTIDVTTRVNIAVFVNRMCVISKEASKFCFGTLSHEEKQQEATRVLQAFANEANADCQKKLGQVISTLLENAYGENVSAHLAPTKGWQSALVGLAEMASGKAPTPAGIAASLNIFIDCMDSIAKDVNAVQQHLSLAIQNAFNHEDVKIQVAGVELVLTMVRTLSKAEWAPLKAACNRITEITKDVAQRSVSSDPKCADLLTRILEESIEVAGMCPEFFKEQLLATAEPARMMKQIADMDQMDEGARKFAIEWLVTYIEKRPKFVAKHKTEVITMAVEVCMKFMSDVPDDQGSLNEWIGRMDDEEGEDDAEGISETGAQSIDRIVQAISEASNFDSVKGVIGAALQQYLALGSWQSRYAVLTAIKQTVEYVDSEEFYMQQFYIIQQCVDHEHPRVRYTALHSLGQLANDQSPDFQDKTHQVVMPLLFKKMNDPVDRVASMAMSAFVSFGEELDGSLLSDYVKDAMEILQRLLSTKDHRMVVEEAVTSIAVIAASIGGDKFMHYYDQIMPFLKNIVITKTDDQFKRMRGKAFECMTLLGISVGKEKFLPDCREAMNHMLQAKYDPSDIQAEYIKEATERIVKCLKEDFVPYLPYVLPRIVEGLNLDREAPADADEEDYFEVQTGDKIVKVHTSKFEEVSNNASLLESIIEEIGDAFYQYIPDVGTALNKVLNSDGEMALLLSDVRKPVQDAWASLIKCAYSAEKAKNDFTLTRKLVTEIVQINIKKMEGEDDDCEELATLAEGIAQALDNGPVLSAADVMPLVNTMYVLMESSMKRSHENQEQSKTDNIHTPDLANEEGDKDDDSEDREEHLRRVGTDVLGAIMKGHPAEFEQLQLAGCAKYLTKWAKEGYTVTCVCLAVELFEHLKERSANVWEIITPLIFEALKGKPSDRITASYALNFASKIPQFAKAVTGQCLTELATALPPLKKKKDDEATQAAENVISAMLSFAKAAPELIPANIDIWTLITDRIPIKFDPEEAKSVHTTLAQMLLEQHPVLTQPKHLKQLLKCFSEIYGDDDVCPKETKVLVHKIFTNLPVDTLKQCDFSEKQQKKITEMISKSP